LQTKMKFTPSSRRNEYVRRKRLLIATLIIGCILLFIRVSFPSFASSSVQLLFQPLFGIANAVGIDIDTVVDHIHSKQSLLEERRELQNTLNEYRAKILMFNSVKEENKQLSKAVGRSIEDQKVIPAIILVKPPQSAYDSIIIDIGRDEGVAEGDWLYTNEYIYLGRVMNAGISTSHVQLASSPGVETQAVILPAGIHLTVSGLGGGSFEAELPIDIEIKKGDVIMTRGSTPSVIAIVEEVSSRPSDSFQILKALSPINVSALRWVSIYQTKDLIDVL